MPNARIVNSAVHEADRILAKKKDFRNQIIRLDAHNKIGAESLAHDGNLESTVRLALQNNNNRDNHSSKDDKDVDEAWGAFEAFLQQQREKIKGLTKIHIEMNQKVDALIGAVEDVKRQIHQHPPPQQQQRQTDDDNSKPPDYELILQTKMELLKQQLEDQSGPVENHPWMKNTLTNMREVAASSRGGNGDDDDDDVQLEFSNNESSAEYKCPITCQYMENPMRNTVCGHVFDLSGIQFHMRNKRSGRACPVPGCANKNLSMDQMEQDVEKQLKVKRFLKRMEQEKQQRLSQTEDLDDF
eukprot:CAMPEP_0176485868 /NCGR_PEP_ID=MMETSP0200_2-20121128/5268_1 /TAXON_ID=947934 /ORGANISM="Chaetoceros sp., Strain GSL56" /LENGTH=298 /DNA_ID=CAMNT_0017882539 /DNA_START=113 /DNA_END=1009 /DNA_ORIENTATION=+